MPIGYCRKLTCKQLEEYTDNFSKDSHVGNTQFGSVYRGKIAGANREVKEVTVKIWEETKKHSGSPQYPIYSGDNGFRLMDELNLLRHRAFISHPGMMKLYGFCFDTESFGVVYDFIPLDSVFNVILKDSFTWLHRIKVAIGVAFLLRTFHAQKPFGSIAVRNLDAAHILLDSKYNPKLYDFSLITGGIFPDRNVYPRYPFDCLGSSDYCYRKGYYGKESDVFSFGCLLMSLISKQVTATDPERPFDPCIYYFALEKYGFFDSEESDPDIETSECSLVHGSLENESDFNHADGIDISRLAIRCVLYPDCRPDMEEVVEHLLNLEIVRCHADELNLKELMDYDIAKYV